MEVLYVILGYTWCVDPMWWFPKIGVPPLLDGLVLGKSNFEVDDLEVTPFQETSMSIRTTLAQAQLAQAEVTVEG